MPAINLDELVPEDIVFTFRKKTYTIPGDLDTDATFDLMGLFGKYAVAEAAGDVPAMRRVNKLLERELLGLFRLADPSLERLPFGTIGYRQVLVQVLQALGLQIVDDGAADPPKPRPKPRSRRSSGPRR